MSAVVGAARKTRDLRFLDIATWFAECFEATLSGGVAPAARSKRRIDEIRSSGRVALEVFVSRDVRGVRLDVPFILSPHWRY